MKDELYVGVTTWNSEYFLEQCLRSIKNTTDGLGIRLGVVDNVSTDRSVEIARDYGAEVHIEHCRQSIALNHLLSQSAARHTLLLHSDVILLSSRWYTVCAEALKNQCALVSPEDIGCGPLTRTYGKGKPESCFMMFDTEKARKARTVTWRKRKGIPMPKLHLDMDDYYVTHDLPETLARKGYTWQPMRVHASPCDTTPVYEPPFTPEYWSELLSHLRYGMGNFYSLGGEVTHYHNWFDRVPKDVPLSSLETTEGDGKGLPLAYLSLTTRKFMADFAAGQLVLPLPDEPEMAPSPPPRHEPDLNSPFSQI